MQLIALVLIDIKLPVFNGSESSKAMERISQGEKIQRAKRQISEKTGHHDWGLWSHRQGV